MKLNGVEMYSNGENFEAGEMAENGYDHHFPTAEGRDRSSSRHVSRSGRAASPTHSAHGMYIRQSLARQVKRAKKVRFYRNGDRFFKGIIYAVSSERFRTFESLMAELTESPLCDKNIMPNGVRAIFDMDGHKISDIDEMEDGESYVCATIQFFRKVDYPVCDIPNWSFNMRAGNEPGMKFQQSAWEDENREYIRPKLITVIRNGSKPRKAVRVLLNKKTAHSFDQVLNDINDAIKLDTGAVKKIFTMEGRPVQQLVDFFGDESVFVAYGPERYSHDDFDLDSNEIRYVSAYSSVRQKERITLKSPKVARRFSSTSQLASTNGSNGVGPISPVKVPSSPKSPRRAISGGGGGRTKSPNLGRRSPAGGYHCMSPSRRGPESPLSSRSKSPARGNESPSSSRSKSPARISSPQTNGNGAGHLHTEAPPADMTETYKIGQLIGEGNFAVVKECVHRSTKKPYALKIISKSRCRGKEQMIDNEVSILRRVKHPNIIQLVEDYETPDEIYLVMELIKGGDLFDAITMATKYTEKDASGMLYNLVGAVKYLHNLNIVHRDIKPENILVCPHDDGTKSLKLGDFGLACQASEELYVVCGTPTYVAPEVLAETGYGVKVDIWACGVIMYILLCGFPPFVSTKGNQEELFDRIMEGKFAFTSPFWDDISSSAKELIMGMLTVDIDDRMSAAEVLAHPWVADDAAKTDDMRTGVAGRLENFKPSNPKFSNKEQPGVHLLAATALDKASRYFQGRRNLQLQQFDNDINEVF